MTEALDKNIDLKYKKAAQVISSAGGTPIPVSDTVVDILKYAVPEEYIDFIMAFRRKRSQTLCRCK